MDKERMTLRSVSINVIATNNYLEFLPNLIDSIDKFFFKNFNVNIIIYTNLDISEIKYNSNRIKISKTHIEHESWPFITLKRFHYFLSSEDKIIESEYSFYVDVDSLFIKEIDESILPEYGMIGTIHPCLFNSEGTPERNPQSKAFIPYGSGNRYFCGGFFGGSSLDFIKMSREIKNNIDYDLSKGIIAIWHDESHINKFFFDKKPAITLEHPFAVAESLTPVMGNSRILFLDKNIRGGHDFFRN